MNLEAKALIEKAVSMQKEWNKLRQLEREREEVIAHLQNTILQCQKQISDATAELQRLQTEETNSKDHFRMHRIYEETKSIERQIKSIVKTNTNNVRKEFATSRSNLYQAIIERDGAVCQGCGYGSSLQIDHILPVVLGGTNDLANLQMLCSRCNAKKSGTIFDYLWRQCNTNVSQTI